MPASSFCASRPRRDAQNERDGAGLRSSIAAATPSQLRRSRTTTYASTQLVVFVASLFEVLLAPPRGGTRRQLKGGRALRAGIAPSQQDQLRRSSRSRRRHCPATMSGRRGEKHHRTAPRRIIGQPLDGFATVTYLKLSSFTIYLPKELRSLP